MRLHTACCAVLLAVAATPAADACPRSPDVAAGKPRLTLPSRGLLLSGFGVRFHPILQTKKMHTGVDFAGSVGDPVRSSAGGEVVRAGVEGGYGKLVLIRHGGGVETAYAHLSEIDVQEGACVERGAVIGRLGNTGLSSGPKLHFEVRVEGRFVDPLTVIADGAK